MRMKGGLPQKRQEAGGHHNACKYFIVVQGGTGFEKLK